MTIHARPFAGEDDLARICAFLTAAHDGGWQAGFWHAGDVWWGCYQNTVFDPFQRIRLWQDERGEILGFGWLEGPGAVGMQIRADLRGQGRIEQEMLDWAAESSAGAIQTRANLSDTATVGWLEAQGFTRDAFAMDLLRRDLAAPIAEAPLPEGFVIRHVGGEAEWPERVETHREVWHPSRVTLEAYRRLRAAPGYSADLDLVAAGPDGRFAAYCICWMDAANRIGYFEPVGTRPAYRGRRLGQAVMLEGLRRLRERGATTAVVASVATNTASRRLYESVGFTIVEREHLYQRKEFSGDM